jgi:levanbiose-producing levanase
MATFLIFTPKGFPFGSFLLLLFGLLAELIPLAAGQMRPSYHITPKEKWMNDPQRPFFLGGEWHLYYLWNSDWDTSNPGAGGTEWYHVTSTDMVDWTDQGVAIRKYQPNTPGGQNLGDIETGSSVVDIANVTGFGQDAVVALVTQMGDGVQQQSLFYSTNSGYSFAAFDANPVMPNPDPREKPAFRDPKVFWYDKGGHWVTALAEGNKIGFYISADLRAWAYASGFYPIDFGVDLGLLECPDMYQIDLDGNNTKRSWILSVGANGYRYGKTTGTVYWDGTWDGTKFTPRASFPRWMDDGPDFYATVGWESLDDKYGSRHVLGWMNNWEYAATLPYYGGFQGQQSLVRDVRYRTVNGTPTLVTNPIAGYDTRFANPISVGGTTITEDPATASIPANLSGGAYRIQATISKTDGDDGKEVRFRIKSDGNYSTTVGYNFVNDEAFLVRGSDGSASKTLTPGPKKVWDTIRTGRNLAGGNTIKLAIYVDWNSVEVFVNDGVTVLSALIYPNVGAEVIEVITDSGRLTLDSFTYSSFVE